VKIYNEIQINGYSKGICNKPFISEIYEELYFDKENIIELDQETKILKNLKKLSLNNNQIEKIANVPQNLKQLTLYYNFTKTIDSKIYQENLIFLGLGYNCLTDEMIGSDILCFLYKI